MGFSIPAWLAPGATKLALAFRAEFIVTVQIRLAPELAQSPPQPVKIEFPEAIAVSTTCDPLVIFDEHVPELTPPARLQAIPPELEDTVPEPVPTSVTCSA